MYVSAAGWVPIVGSACCEGLGQGRSTPNGAEKTTVVEHLIAGQSGNGEPQLSSELRYLTISMT
jgi:hypothetical protein